MLNPPKMQSYSPQSMPPPPGSNIQAMPPTSGFPSSTAQASTPPAGTADYLEQLPTDNQTPTNDEIHVIDTIFKKETTTMQKILIELREALIVGVLFIILCLPQVDEWIKKIVKAADASPYILILLKACIFIFLFYAIKNLYIVRNKK